MLDLIFRPVFDFRPALGGRDLIASGVGPGGRLLAVAGSVTSGEPWPPNQARIPGGRFDPINRPGVALVVDPDGRMREIPVDCPLVRYPIVQPLPDGGLVIAASRVRADEEPNALVFDAGGRLTRRIMFGDGIEHLLVDDLGRAWVGYFDEGVFGNLGWGFGGGPEPIGSAGLLRFGLVTGDAEWEFSPPEDSDTIADCYALNVDGNDAWLYYYTDFDVFRIGAGGEITRWLTSTSGCHGLAVDEHRVLLVGGYKRGYASTLWRRAAETLEDPAEVRLVHADGREPTGRLAFRGSQIFLTEEGLVSLADMRDL